MHSLILVFVSTLVLGLSSSLSGAENQMRVETFSGKKIAPYTQNLVRLCSQFYQEYPYFYAGSDADYTAHLESFAQSEKGVVSITFDGDKVVGAATGIPLAEAWDKYQEPLRQKGFDISKVFYLGELALLPAYQGQGFGQQMVREVEKFAKEKDFSILCTTQIDASKIQAKKPSGYKPFEDRIFNTLGFQRHPELNFVSLWTDTDGTKEAPHLMFYWTKSLK